jgi:beta-galactosidase
MSHGRIVATDNGNATDHISFQSPSRKAFNGLCLVIVAAEKGASGNITVKGESRGLKTSTVTINIGK